MIESQIQRNARARIVVEIESCKQAILGLIAGQAIKLVVKRGQIPHRQPLHVPRGDQATGTAPRASHIFHRRIADVLHCDAVVADFRAFALKLPAFALLMNPASVNKQTAYAHIMDCMFGIVDRFPQDDCRAIRAIHEPQNGRRAGTAQCLMIPLQHDGIGKLKISGRQHHFAGPFRQGIQCPLDLSAGHAGGQLYDHRSSRWHWKSGYEHHRQAGQTNHGGAFQEDPPASGLIEVRFHDERHGCD